MLVRIPCDLITTKLSFTRGQYRAVQALAGFDDARSAGLLLEAFCHYPDPATKRTAASALQALLPQLGPADVDAMSDQQRRLLGHQLSYSQTALKRRGAGPDLILVALQTVEQTRLVSALEAVKRLASGRGLSADEPIVREVALACLTRLREHSGESNNRTLLRPSAPGGDTLFRPSASQDDPAPEQLLRASGKHRQP